MRAPSSNSDSATFMRSVDISVRLGLRPPGTCWSTLGCDSFVFKVHQIPRRETVNDVLSPELIVVGGPVYTADPQMEWVEGFAVQHGTVVAVGSESEIRGLAV